MKDLKDCGEIIELESVTYSELCFGEVFEVEYVTYSEMCFGEVFEVELTFSHYSCEHANVCVHTRMGVCMCVSACVLVHVC